MYKIVLTLLLCATAGTVFASKMVLSNYGQLAQAITKGDDVLAIVNFANCKSNKEIKGKGITRFNFNIFSNYQVKRNDQMVDTIATSNTIFTEHSKLGPVYAYGRIRLYGDNTADIHTAFYDPKTFELKDSSDFQCAIGENAGVMLVYRFQ